MRGRASELTDLGDGRLLRRGGDPARESALMEHARTRGFPVPHVYEVRDDALVIERIDGPTMEADALTRPWRLVRHMRTLARLHDELHRLEHPEGGTLIHRDLQPQNVLHSPEGPVVVDWTNAGAGDAAVDVELTWLIMRTSGGRVGQLAALLFGRQFDAGALRRGMPEACAYRLADPNVSSLERARVRRLERRYC